MNTRSLTSRSVSTCDYGLFAVLIPSPLPHLPETLNSQLPAFSHFVIWALDLAPRTRTFIVSTVGSRLLNEIEVTKRSEEAASLHGEPGEWLTWLGGKGCSAGEAGLGCTGVLWLTSTRILSQFHAKRGFVSC